MLATEAMRGRFYAFITSCECGTAYRIETEADGVHCKAAGDPAAISEQYEALPVRSTSSTTRAAASGASRCRVPPSAGWSRDAPSIICPSREYRRDPDEARRREGTRLVVPRAAHPGLRHR